MLKKINTLIAIFIILVSIPVYAQQTTGSSQNQVQMQQVPGTHTQPAWSKNATDEETRLLLKEADLLLNKQEKPISKNMASEVLSSSQIDSGLTNTQNAVDQKTTDIQPAAATPQPSESFQSVFYAWLPGFGALIVSGVLLIMVKKELKRNHHAALKASQLINDISDLQNNIKEWELENHYSHISEISEHIDALEAAVDSAKAQRNHIDTSINTSIELNKKSLDILKRANKELSKSLANQVHELENQLNQTVADGVRNIKDIASEQIRALSEKQTGIMTSINSNTNSSGLTATQAAGLNSAPKPQQNWMDIIKAETNKTAVTSSNKPSHSTTALDHAAMLRESIERQKAILNQHKSMNMPSESSSNSLSSFMDGLKSSNLLKNNKTEQPVIKPKIENDKQEKPLTQNNAVMPKEVDLESITEEIVKETPKAKSITNTQNQDKDIDESKLLKKLEHAQKWHNFADGAEICSQLAEIKPADAEIYDTWGQMLARHAADIKGNEGTELLKLANKKMHKASILDSSNYKIFNNWGIILKNLALTYSNTHEAEKTLALARRKFETSISLNPSNHEALSNWGNALIIQARYRSGTLQESLLQKACEKFEEAIKLKPDKSNTLHSWGNALFRLANCKKDPETRNSILQMAHSKWQAANKIKPGIANKELRVIKSMVPPLSRSEQIQKEHQLHK